VTHENPLQRDPRLPEDWTRIETVDAHAAGEPLRVVVDGFPAVEGESILDRRRYVEATHDDLRTALLLEPRGHADMYGALLTEAVSEEADVGVLFATNEGYSTMCGHGIIALGTVLVETGMLPASPPTETIGFDTPAGLVTATAHLEDDRDVGDGADREDDEGDEADRDAGDRVVGERVASVSFGNVPSFVAARDARVDVPGYGVVEYDLAYGGAFYAYCDVDQFECSLTPEDADAIRHAGMAVKRAVAEAVDVQHPRSADLEFLYGTILRGPPEDPANDSRNACVFADGQLDRSPTGTGVSGRVALASDRGNLDVGDAFVVESVIGTTFTGTVVAETTVDGRPAVVPRVEGSAHVTGRSEFVLDPTDPLGDGFRLG
jgi:proline racemase